MHITEKISPRHFLFIFLSLLFVFFGCSTSNKTARTNQSEGIEQKSILTKYDSLSQASPAREQQPSVNGNMTVDSLIDGMSLREKIGQLFFIRAHGYFESNDSNYYQNLVHQIKDYHIGGITFFSGTVYGQTILTNKLQKISKIPLWITEDMEHGPGMRIRGATNFVPSMGVAATQKPDYAYWIGKITAQEARALGVDQIFAPVLDVNNNPKNPVINVRSFSGNPDTVAKYGKRFIDGVQSEGVIATGKHFPGHGDTDTDSHLELPIVHYGYARLDSVELVPFRSAVNDSIGSIMSAHIAFPKISDFSGLPATMDSTVLNRILIDSLNFSGTVFTDGLEMHGITSNFSPGEAVIKALKAGADLMLLSPDDLTAIDEIELAVENGRLSEQRINRSVRKLLTWKKEHGLFKHHKIDIDALSSRINTRKHQLLANEISRKSLTLVKNNDHILPLRAADYPHIMVVSVSDEETGTAGSSFVAGLKDYHPNVTSHVLDRRTGKEEKEEMLKDAQKADLLIIGSFIYVKSGEKVQISKDHLDFLKKLSRDKPSVLVAFGNPYVVQDLPETDVQLMAWSAGSEQVHSVVPALFGGSKISGRLPILIPGMYHLNDGVTLPQTALRYDEPEVVGLSRDSLQRVDHIMHKAIFDSTFPGGVVAVVKNGVIAYQKGFGYQTYKKLNPVKNDEIYDLASLTKVTATTPAVMKLIDEGKLHLDDKVGKFFPEFRKGKKRQITIRNLLLHNSGLPAFRVYVDSIKTEKGIVNAVKHEPLINDPGEKYVYSDLGFILLGKIVEKITGMPLNKYVRKTFYYPMGMHNTFFNPKQVGRWISDRIPPTEIDTTFRMKTMQAQVQDERAYYMNGVAGHAGLFSSAGDLAIYCQMLLNKGSYAGKQYIKPSTIATFTKRQSKRSNRGYGFDRKSPGFSTAGSLTSNKTFGHLGFSGTSYWIDPEQDLAIIILTNRTYPHRSYGHNINQIRAKVADAVVSSIID